MSLPKEPRQKMINLMYLVLTAMLALNVSAEILNAFKTVDRSLINTNKTINASTSTIVKSLEGLTTKQETAEKAKIWYAKAQQAQTLTNDMNSYIEGIRMRILKEAEFDPAKNGDSNFKQDNLDIATRIMVTEGEGKKLQQKLKDYKQALLNIDPLIAKEFENSLQIDVNPPPVQSKANKTWQDAYFQMVPTVAAITILSKFQNDVKTSENKVVAFCHQQVGQVEVKFDQFAPIVGQSTNYLMPGQELTITAGVGAFNSAAQPTISIGGSGAQVVNGVASKTVNVGGVGSGSVPVVINYVDQDGNRKTFQTEAKYTVGQSATAISLDKMNVLYIGVDNPVSIAASGGAEQLNPSIVGGGGSLTKVGPGKYIARVSTQTDDCKIVVNVAGKTAGQQVFRVRSIPDPVASVGNMPSGSRINAGAFRSQAGVGAGIKDFPFELKYSVTAFTVIGDAEDGGIDEAPCTGNTWSPRARSIINRMKPGGIVTIENIRAVGPDGRSRALPALLYNIQ
ncbi:MAG: gliding motility protein GldM [Chitinophagaceae bacterium]